MKSSSTAHISILIALQIIGWCEVTNHIINREPVYQAPPILDRADTRCTTDTECEALDHPLVLIGYGCGPEKVTSYALEEDEFLFPYCDIIEPRRVIGNFKRS